MDSMLKEMAGYHISLVMDIRDILGSRIVRSIMNGKLEHHDKDEWFIERGANRIYFNIVAISEMTPATIRINITTDILGDW